MSLTLSQLVSNERAVWSILGFRLGDHHGGERGDKAVLQGYVQNLSFYSIVLLLSTNVTGRQKRKTGSVGS